MIVRERIERAQWTWRGNRQLVHASRRRSLRLTLRALFRTPPLMGNNEMECNQSGPIRAAGADTEPDDG